MKTEREKVKVKYTPAYQTYHSAGDEAEPYCPKCDADLSYDEYNYCPWCGVELDWEPEPETNDDDAFLDEFTFDTERACPNCKGIKEITVKEPGYPLSIVCKSYVTKCPICIGTGLKEREAGE